MKKIDLTSFALNTTEEELIILTPKQAEMLSSGELTFRDGMLYRTEDLSPREVLTHEMTVEGPLLNLYGTDKEIPKLEAVVNAEDLVPRPIDMNNLVVENPTYLTPTMPHKSGLSKLLDRLYSSQREISREQYTLTAFAIYSEYVKEVDQHQYKCNNWEIGLKLQNKYWDIFRGYSMEVIRLSVANKIRNTKPFELVAPVEGMKKR